mmetsp:Transcript_23711/g.36052  ORF Transcript_23711/g.36052 Transcript_23711/m.36052 type:complete len:85 (+) Transcript_23711:242-496(+)
MQEIEDAYHSANNCISIFTIFITIFEFQCRLKDFLLGILYHHAVHSNLQKLAPPSDANCDDDSLLRHVLTVQSLVSFLHAPSST